MVFGMAQALGNCTFGQIDRKLVLPRYPPVFYTRNFFKWERNQVFTPFYYLVGGQYLGRKINPNTFNDSVLFLIHNSATVRMFKHFLC